MARPTAVGKLCHCRWSPGPHHANPLIAAFHTGLRSGCATNAACLLSWHEACISCHRRVRSSGDGPSLNRRSSRTPTTQLFDLSLAFRDPLCPFIGGLSHRIVVKVCKAPGRHEVNEAVSAANASLLALGLRDVLRQHRAPGDRVALSSLAGRCRGGGGACRLTGSHGDALSCSAGPLSR